MRHTGPDRLEVAEKGTRRETITEQETEAERGRERGSRWQRHMEGTAGDSGRRRGRGREADPGRKKPRGRSGPRAREKRGTGQPKARERERGKGPGASRNGGGQGGGKGGRRRASLSDAPRALRAPAPHPGATSGPRSRLCSRLLPLHTRPSWAPRSTCAPTSAWASTWGSPVSMSIQKHPYFVYPSVSTRLHDCLPPGRSGGAACLCLGVRGCSGDGTQETPGWTPLTAMLTHLLTHKAPYVILLGAQDHKGHEGTQGSQKDKGYMMQGSWRDSAESGPRVQGVRRRRQGPHPTPHTRTVSAASPFSPRGPMGPGRPCGQWIGLGCDLRPHGHPSL